MTKYKGEIVLLLVALMWGTGFVVTSAALDRFEPFQLLAVRFFISAVLMAIIFYKKLLALNKNTFKYGVILGLFLFLGFACQTVGLQYTTPGKNAFLTAVNVVIVPFIGALAYRRKIDIHSVLGAFTALIGIACLSLTLDAPISMGDVLTLVGAVFFALHVFFTTEFMSRGTDTGSVVTVQMAAVCVFAFFCALATGQTDFSRADMPGALMLIYMAVFTTSLCFFLQTWAQSFTSETKAAIVMSMESVFGSFFSVLLGYEAITVRMLAGAVMIIGGVLITEVKPSFGFLKVKKE